MLTTTSIASDTPFVTPDSWLDRYCTIARHRRFPMSYHLLTGIWVLSTIMGRRCRIALPECNLYPPISILLIGESGVGKSAASKMGWAVLKSAKLQAPFPLFLEQGYNWNPAALITQWVKWQLDDPDKARGPGAGEPLEGTIFNKECGTLFQKSTGHEHATNFLIEAHEHDTMNDLTVSKGLRLVYDVTVSFCFNTTISDMRASVDANVFSGGLMHRLLIAHELDRPTWDTNWTFPEQALRDLSTTAIAIRDGVPEKGTADLDIASDVRLRYGAIQNRAEDDPMDMMCLKGFWNRFAGMAMKLAAVRAFSDSRYDVTVEDIDAADHLLRKFIYPPLVELIMELSARPKQKLLYAIADDVYARGRYGHSTMWLLRRLGVDATGGDKLITQMVQMGLIYPSSNGNWDRYYRTPAWAAAGEEPPKKE